MLNDKFSDNDVAILILKNITDILDGIERDNEGYIQAKLQDLKNNVSNFEQIFYRYKSFGLYNRI